MTTTPTIISALASTAFRPPARINGPCPQHPDVHRLACEPCLAAVDARAKAAERAETVAAAADNCDARITARYRDASCDHPDVVAWADRVIGDPTAAGDLLLLGPLGTGKTWQAYGAIRRIATHPIECRSGGWRCMSWRGGTHTDIAASMRPSAGVDAEQVMGDYRRAQVLLVDDLATARDSAWVEEVTYRLINTRYNDQKPTIFTSNLRGSEIRNALGDRIASRLAHTCQTVVMSGPDRRRAA